MRLLLISILAWLAFAPVEATLFPKVPASTRILTAEEVQNFWFNTLRQKRFPSKPSSLYPAKQAQWESALRARQSHLREILNGKFLDAAELAALRHNVEAYRSLGDTAKLAEAEKELRIRREHRATLALLRTQRKSSERIADAVERATDTMEDCEQEDDHCPQPVHVPVHHPDPCPEPPPSPPSPPSEPLFPFPDQREVHRG